MKDHVVTSISLWGHRLQGESSGFGPPSASSVSAPGALCHSNEPRYGSSGAPPPDGKKKKQVHRA